MCEGEECRSLVLVLKIQFCKIQLVYVHPVVLCLLRLIQMTHDRLLQVLVVVEHPSDLLVRHLCLQFLLRALGGHVSWLLAEPTAEVANTRSLLALV